MKKNKLNICAAFLAICLAAFTSCSTDAEGTLYNGEGAELAFASTQMNVQLAAEDNGVIKVPVYRGNANGDLSAAIAMDNETIEEGLFTLAAPAASFKNGENVAYVEISFSLAELGATDKYEIGLTLTDEKSLSPTALGAITVTAQRKLTWENYGVGVYTSELFGDSWDQPIEKAKEGNIYRLPDCITEGYPMVFSLSDDGQTLLSWDPQQTGYKHATYGMVYFSPAGMERDGNVLTFPMRGLVVVTGGFGILYQGFNETLEMPK